MAYQFGKLQKRGNQETYTFNITDTRFPYDSKDEETVTLHRNGKGEVEYVEFNDKSIFPRDLEIIEFLVKEGVLPRAFLHDGTGKEA